MARAIPDNPRVSPSRIRRLINPPWLRLPRAGADGVEDLVFIFDELEFYVDVLLW
jgi:hypothetical protein